MSYILSIFNAQDAADTKYAAFTRSFSSLERVGDTICLTAWAPGTFKPDADGRLHRLNTNLDGMNLLVFDIDEGMTLAEAAERLSASGYSHIIATSRNHQKTKVLKSGKVKPACDRFRVVLPLSSTITSDADYKATWYSVKQSLLPAADEACKDAARFYYPCTQLVNVTSGYDVPVVKAQPKIEVIQPKKEAAEGERGILSRRTLQFLAVGPDADPSSSWHHQFFKAAVDLKEQGYGEDEAEAMLTKASTYEPPHLDEEDLKQLRDVYSRETKYGPRLPDSTPGMAAAPPPGATTSPLVVRASDFLSPMVTYLSDKDKVRGMPTFFEGLDKLLGGGKRTGEITVTHAHAKTGKNTLWHDMMYRWLEAGTPLAYASREITPESEVLPNLLSLKYNMNAWLADPTPELVAKYSTALASWPLYFANGYGCFPLDELTAWVDACVSQGIRYFWIDHLHYMLEDPEDHKYASKFIKELKAIAKSRDIHIDLIVQPNKLMDGQGLNLNSIKGGAAIGQALDNLLTMERVKGEGAPENIVKLTLEVARSKLARPGSIYLQYNPTTTSFVEVERTVIEEPKEEGPRFPKPFGQGFGGSQPHEGRPSPQSKSLFRPRPS